MLILNNCMKHVKNDFNFNYYILSFEQIVDVYITVCGGILRWISIIGNIEYLFSIDHFCRVSFFLWELRFILTEKLRHFWIQLMIFIRLIDLVVLVIQTLAYIKEVEIQWGFELGIILPFITVSLGSLNSWLEFLLTYI